MEGYKKETLPNGTVVLTSKQFAITTDSLLLAQFCPVHARWSACDLGSGSGLLLLSLADRGLKGPMTGVELREEGAAMLAEAASINGLHNVTAVCADLRVWRGQRPVDLVVANPPYFAAGAPSPNAQRAVARHDTSCTPQQLCEAAARLLKDGGAFCLCWPAARLATMIGALLQSALAPKRMQLVRKAPNADAWLCLLDARKAGGEGLTVLPELILPPGQAVHY